MNASSLACSAATNLEGYGGGAVVPLGQTQDIAATYWQVAPPVIKAQRVTLAH